MVSHPSRPGVRLAALSGLALLLTWLLAAPPGLRGQDPQASGQPPAGGPSAATGTPTGGLDRPAPAQQDEGPGEDLRLFNLLWESKWFMLPIFAMSLLVVAVTVERFLGMRAARVLPRGLVEELGEISGPQGFDPRAAYRICQKYPSSAASVICAMLLKVGRPHSEVEHAVSESSEREAQRMYGNVRWLELAAGVTPLMGLFGTVWGMIRAFHDTTVMAPGVNKADYLAEGIYLALVTTLGGLAVAIPAVILAHYFEGRIENLFHRIDELVSSLTPQVERYEGRVRFSHTTPPVGASPTGAPPTGPGSPANEPPPPPNHRGAPPPPPSAPRTGRQPG